jgi:hypothetical protein
MAPTHLRQATALNHSSQEFLALLLEPACIIGCGTSCAVSLVSPKVPCSHNATSIDFCSRLLLTLMSRG